MGRIRDKMEQDLVLLGRSEATRESYLMHARLRRPSRQPARSHRNHENVRRWTRHSPSRGTCHEAFHHAQAGRRTRPSSGLLNIIAAS